MTKGMAERALRDFRAEVDAEQASAARTPRDTTKLEAVATAHLAQLESGGTRRTTLADYRGYLSRHVLPFFGNVPLKEIAISDVEDFIEHQQRSKDSGGKGLMSATVSNHVNYLHSIFAFAQRREIVDRNAVSVARKPKASRPRSGAFLSMEQIEATVRAVPDDYLGQTDRTIILTAALTGLRQGELIALRWRDILWIESRVQVRSSVSRGVEGDTKSETSRRRVPLPTRIAEALEVHFQQTCYPGDDDRVFCHPHTGRPYDPSRMRGRFYTAMRAAGLGHLIGRKGGGITFHSLRHTYGTQTASAGVPLVAVKEWMGHADIATTMIYAEWSKDTAAERAWVDKAFGVAESSVATLRSA